MVQMRERCQQDTRYNVNEDLLRSEIEHLEKLLYPAYTGHGLSRAAQMYRSRLENVRRMLGKMEESVK